MTVPGTHRTRGSWAWSRGAAGSCTRLLGLVLLLWWTGLSQGCCPSGDVYLLESTFSDFPRQGFQLTWGGVTYGYLGVDTLRVELPRNTELRRGVEMLELYVDGTSRVALAGQLMRDVAIRRGDSSCTWDYLVYPLSELPDGVYTIVHRRSSAPEGLLLQEFRYTPPAVAWDTFDGEDALITTFPYPPGFVPDGGLPDGGPRDGGP